MSRTTVIAFAAAEILSGLLAATALTLFNLSCCRLCEPMPAVCRHRARRITERF